MRITEVHEQLDKYRCLDDTIVQQIEMSEDIRLRTAQKYLLRLKKLDFYPVVSNAKPTIAVNHKEIEIFLNLPLPGSAINTNVLYHDEHGNISQKA